MEIHTLVCMPYPLACFLQFILLQMCNHYNVSLLLVQNEQLIAIASYNISYLSTPINNF